MEKPDSKELVEILFAQEGHRDPKVDKVGSKVTVSDFLKHVTQGDPAEFEFSSEDANEPIGNDLLIGDVARRGGQAVFHVSRRGLIAVHVTFNGRVISKDFRPNVTMNTIVIWAMRELRLDGVPSDYQLKYRDQLLPPGDHLGQITHGAKEIKLTLVMKIKPQG